MNLQREPEIHNIPHSSLSLFKQQQNENSSAKVGFVFQNSNNFHHFLPKPEETRVYQELYPNFIDKMMYSFESESVHRRNLEKEASEHKKLMSEKLVDSQVLSQMKYLEIEYREQKHRHVKFYVALCIGLIVFFSSFWLQIENKIAFIGLYILLAVLGISPSHLFIKKNNTELPKSNKI
ncbi:hypothetical protein [Silvanigrella aquatica]|uniref:DUF2335 domain-containing protein n=1 Tax=Silvanigrella aquatica TaxID=1915309 RepID=A0A1L4CXB6_9BACT|nr:hypothetical protein [Silvanigrella aquatica]APJ02586.1 hypothetical protein AXG55_01010 [Silvanigrella aquatica]